MKSKHILPLKAESFVLLVNQLRLYFDQADLFEINLDLMKVKGDLAVIQDRYKKPLIAKSNSLDLLRRGVTAGMYFVDLPHDLEENLEFKNLLKNKKPKVIRSYHNFEKTPSREELIKTIEALNSKTADYIKVATQIIDDEDSDALLSLLEIPSFKGRLIITGMGEKSRRVRIEAPLKGSVFYYAPLNEKFKTAKGQLSKAELEKEWGII